MAGQIAAANCADNVCAAAQPTKATGSDSHATDAYLLGKSVLANRSPAAIRATSNLPTARRLTLTPMVPSDWQFLETFPPAVPESEQRFFRQDTTIAERVERWCSELDYRHVLPLLAWNGDRIVGDATLEQEPGLWTAHVAKIRLLVHPDFRRRGVGAGCCTS